MEARTTPIRLLLTDSRPVVLRGLDDLITAMKPGMEVVGHATTYAMAIDLARQLQPDVALFSFFADALDPLRVISALAHNSATKVLVLKDLSDAVPVSSAIEAGARGVVLAEDPIESITRAIIRVHEDDGAANQVWIGGLTRLAARARAPLNGDPEYTKLAQLTSRERELIGAIVADPAAKYITIGARLNITEHTVHNHLSSIYSKLGLINRSDLLVYALKHQIADGGDPIPSRWTDLT